MDYVRLLNLCLYAGYDKGATLNIEDRPQQKQIIVNWDTKS